jgi:ATP-dependent helicase YprA (DUF1998 family)
MYFLFVKSYRRNRRYVQDSAVRASDAKKYLENYFSEGRLWPEPLVQINPSFEPGRWIDELIKVGDLHPECGKIFRRRDAPNTFGDPIRLHRHQDEAILAAKSNKSYVLTTGTGSGKSLAYFIPIVDHVLRTAMAEHQSHSCLSHDALANSQEEALERFLHWGYQGSLAPVSFAKYTGQENEEERHRIWENPPDILLTNFVMLELILTRTNEKPIITASQGLEFLVLDELHTYRGRHGADVAMLIRRTRERCGSPTLRCVPSATLSGAKNKEGSKKECISASCLFGDEVLPDTLSLKQCNSTLGLNKLP